MSQRELAAHRLTNVGCVWATWQSVVGFRVRDHVALPLLAAGLSRKKAQQRGVAMLAKLEIDELSDAQLDELSDGERVRVALAHALIRDPRLLLVDEPVSALALVERDEILAILQKLATEDAIAVISTATEAAQVMRAERVLAINDGRLLDHDAPVAPSAEVVELSEARNQRGGGGA